MDNKTFFLISPFALSFLVAANVAVQDLTGYNKFDFANGWNPLCAVDPTCRKLNDDEIELAKKYFGDEIDYSTVNYFSRTRFWGFEKPSLKSEASSVLGNIYDHNDIHSKYNEKHITDGIYLHEMTHVWQYWAGILDHDDDSEHNNTYQFDIDAYDNFLDFGIEQQARMVEVVYLYQTILSKDLPHSYNTNFEACTELNKVEKMAAQELPIEITDCSQFEDIKTAPEI